MHKYKQFSQKRTFFRRKSAFLPDFGAKIRLRAFQMPIFYCNPQSAGTHWFLTSDGMSGKKVRPVRLSISATETA